MKPKPPTIPHHVNMKKESSVTKSIGVQSAQLHEPFSFRIFESFNEKYQSGKNLVRKILTSNSKRKQARLLQKSIEYAEERVKAIKTEEFFQGKKSE